MNVNITVRPNELKEQKRMVVNSEQFLSYSAAYIGRNTYCWNMRVDNAIEFTAHENKLIFNLHIGDFNSIGNDLECVFARNHNYKAISTGGVSLMLQSLHVKEPEFASAFNHKGSIIIQNDVWVGQDVTIMPGVVVRNGAVIARNAHVVKDVPPYAIVGGNPAKIIGYRYTPEQIDMLQTISWWDWSTEKIVENANYFTEDVDGFCNRFYDEARKEFEDYISEREIKDDSYFAFVDYYENYASYPKILEQFLDTFIGAKGKKLILFIQEDERMGTMDAESYLRLSSIVNEIREDASIECEVEMYRGSVEEAKKVFLNCSHYIVSRTYDTVFFSCLADKLNMDIISGVDTLIQFVECKNMKHEG